MQTLYTLGYTGTKPEQIQTLAADLGALVVDTRYSPRSRAVQWTGAGFRRLLGESYRHMPSLGNINYKGDGPIVINKPDEGVPQVAALLEQQPIILLCVCAEVSSCHRAVVAELVQEYCGCEIIHLSAKDLTSPLQPRPLFDQADYSVKPSPTPADPGGTLTLSTQPLPLHQKKMF
jgi:uncharacterized protein (DUF488 family)